VGISLIAVILAGAGLYLITGKDVLPASNSKQFQVRLKAAEGTRIEVTEKKVKNFLELLKAKVGKDNVAISSVFIGQHPSTFAVSPIYLYNAGPHEALMQVA